MNLRFCPIIGVLLWVILPAMGYGQPVLPGVLGVADSGGVLLSWVCQYDGVKEIVVRRSGDSVGNYKIIGYVKNRGRGVQVFADGHPETGNNYYKLNVVFNSGLSWGSNLCKVFVDKTKATLPEQDDATFTVPKYVSVNKLTGHVTITLPDGAGKGHYSIKFYNSKQKMIMEVPEIKSSPVILDKRNFQRKGVYSFILREDGVELESGFVHIEL